MLNCPLPRRLPHELPFVECMRKLGLNPDPWQIEVLHSTQPRLLLNCCRQAGKSRVVGMLGLVQSLFNPGTRVLIVSRSFRQANELFRAVCQFHRVLGNHSLRRRSAERLAFENESEILCVPCKEETIRGISKVDLLIIDEAA